MRTTQELQQPSVVRLPRQRLLAMMVTLLLALTASVIATAPAAAHGGPISAQAGPNGGGGVYVYLYFERDLHPVDEVPSATIEGTLGDRRVGPVEMTRSDSQAGRWETPSGAFSDGNWSLTIRYVEPDSQTEQMIARAIDVNVTGGGTAVVAAQPEAIGAWPFLLAAGVGSALIAVIVLIAVRRRARLPATR